MRREAAVPSDVRCGLRPTVSFPELTGGLRPKGVALIKEAADGRAEPFRTLDGKP